MLKIKPPDYKFCPFCGGKLTIKFDGEKDRKICTSCHWTYYPHVAGSVCAMIVKGKKVLLVKRSREPYINTWMFPAGFINFGEHPLETLKREVKEETGLKLKKAKLVDIFQSTDDPRSPGHFLFFFLVKVAIGRLKTDKAENSAIEWKDIKKPIDIGWQSHQLMFRRLKNKEFPRLF